VSDKTNQRPTGTEASATERRPYTLDTNFTLRTPIEAQISPDGRQVIFQLNEWVPDRPTQRGRIWAVDAEGGDLRPLSDGPDGDYNARFSPDGTWIAFTSKRDEGDKDGKPDPGKDQQQLYRMPASGGETKRVCVMPNGAQQIAWSPDGSRIAFLSLEGPEPKDEPKVDEPLRHQRLWTVRHDYDTPEPITPPDVTVWSYAWSPDSNQIAAFYSAGPGETDWFGGQIGIVPASGGAIRQLSKLTRQAGAFAWSRGGSQLYYVSGEWSDRPLVGGDVFAAPVAGGEARNLTPGIECNPSWLHELPDGRLLHAAWDGVTTSVGVLDPTDGKRTVIEPDYVIGEWSQPRFSATADGRRLAVTHTDPTHPWDVYLGERSGDGIAWRRLTQLNPLIEETTQPATSQRISFEGADGWRIEGLFTPPLEARRGTPPPLILNVHGGPTSAFRDIWLDALTQLQAAAGFAVLRVNPRGSMGRGVAFADAVLGDMGGKDLQDLLAGVDYVVGQGWADGERVGIGGWSYGGFMTAWAVTQTTRFKAAVMGAGVSDFHSFHAQANIGDWDQRIIGVSLIEDPDAYRKVSAITYVKRVVTPTLVLHGEADPFVPVNQAYAFYRALREKGVPTELAIYPREGHGVRERDHMRDMYKRHLNWFEQYL
jgi:dipeptidyl aminopeptidase/acylaminoacyl peptidase